MTVFQWSLSAGLPVAGIGAAAAAALLRGSRRRAAEQSTTPEERAALALQRRSAWQRRLAVIALGTGCLMMFVLAGIAAWLSFGAQREYAHAHNGGDWDAATGFALLLDAGALSLSLIRFFEALTLRSSAITRILLLAFVSASAAMNLLHAPGAGASSAFLAVVPPLVYAILLEMLLFKIEQVIMGQQERRKAEQERAYSLLLWLPWPIGAPVKMWKAWRSELLATVDNVRVIGSQRPRPSMDAARVTVERAKPVAAFGMAPANMVTASASPATAEKAEEPSSSGGTPPAAPMPTLPVSPQYEQEAATQEDREGYESVPVAEPGSAADAGPESQTEPKQERVERTAESSTTGLHAEEVRLPAEREDTLDDWEKGERPDPEHGTRPDDAEDAKAREQLSTDIDLSVLPESLSPRQRAERIYLAHQKAGVALLQSDLGKWAGYKNSNSGGNEYRRLERAHGPIVISEGAARVDLHRPQQPVPA